MQAKHHKAGFIWLLVHMWISSRLMTHQGGYGAVTFAVVS